MVSCAEPLFLEVIRSVIDQQNPNTDKQTKVEISDFHILLYNVSSLDSSATLAVHVTVRYLFYVYVARKTRFTYLESHRFSQFFLSSSTTLGYHLLQ